jgi:hypothetical protein
MIFQDKFPPSVDRKPREAVPSSDTYGRSAMNNDIDAAWAAFERRDRSWNGRVISASRRPAFAQAELPARRAPEISVLPRRRICASPATGRA